MKKMLCVLFGCVFGLTILTAQQDTRYSQYMFNGLVLNPAYAGTRDAISATAFYRNQWSDIEGAPRTISMSLHSPFGERERVGLGIYLENDRIGVTDRYSLFGSYSYKFEMGNGILSTGLQTGLVHYTSRLSQVITGSDDPDIFNEDINWLKPNFGAGLYYYTDNYYMGLSVPNMIDYQSREEGNIDGELAKLTRQYIQYLFTAGMVKELNEAIKLKPSILLKSIPAVAPFQMDANVSFLIRDALWLGATYRSNQDFAPESASFLAAYRLGNGLMFGYSYDVSLNEIRSYTSGSHEIMLNFDKVKGGGESVVSPRYF